ncbi:hypothetical protein BJX70DRAFT_13403 [Aspergillus crustosus]
MLCMSHVLADVFTIDEVDWFVNGKCMCMLCTLGCYIRPGVQLCSGFRSVYQGKPRGMNCLAPTPLRLSAVTNAGLWSTLHLPILSLSAPYLLSPHSHSCSTFITFLLPSVCCLYGSGGLLLVPFYLLLSTCSLLQSTTYIFLQLDCRRFHSSHSLTQCSLCSLTSLYISHYYYP